MDTTKIVHEKFFNELLKELQINGIWSVYFIEGAQKFKTLGYHFAKSLDESFISKIDNEEIYVGFGSNGWAYKYLSEHKYKQICFLNDTYSDPRGTVIEIDYTIGQKHTAFLAIRDSYKNVIGIIMIFGERKFQIIQDKKIITRHFEDYNLYFRLLTERQLLKNSEAILSISPNKTKAQNTTESIKSNLKNLLDNFLKINNQLSIEFLYVINKNKTAPEYISFSELFLKKIEYELKFCSYLNGVNVKCKFLNDNKKNVACQYFLDPFFFKVVNKLKCQNIKYNNFTIKLYVKNTIPNIDNEIQPIFIDKTSLKDIAQEKYENEVITKRIEEIIQDTAFVVCLVYRNEKNTFLIDANDCYRKDKYEEKIRPTNVLPYYYQKKYSSLELLKKYPPLEKNKFSFTKDNAAHIVSVLWNKNGNFNQLLSLNILNRWTEDKKILAYFNDSLKNKIDCELFTLHGINQKQLKNNSIAKSFLELGEKDYTILLQLQDTQQHATRAAISQLYARTDAHDLGHVLDALKSLKDIFSDENQGTQYLGKDHNNNNSIFDELISDIFKTYPIQNTRINYIFYPKLITYFIKFLKERMDFRADVATTDPNSLSTLDFYKEVFLPFNNNLIFNNRISGINDKDLHYFFEINSNDSKKNGRVIVPVAIPNDVLGCHAFYIILSNIIRNTIKHGDVPDNGEIKFTIEIDQYKSNNEFYEIKIYSNFYKTQITDEIKKNIKIIKENSGINNTKKEEELKKYSKYSDIKGLVENRNKTFDKTVLNNQTNRLRDSALGSIEMATCAAYLRKLPVTSVEDKNFKLFEDNTPVFSKKVNDKIIPKLLFAYPQNNIDNSDEFSLGYKLYLLRPKEILIVSEAPEEIQKSLFESNSDIDFNKEGIDFIKPEQLKNGYYDHRFLVFLGENDGLKNLLKNTKDNLSAIPKRKIALNPYSKYTDKISFLKDCWKFWNKEHKKGILINCSDSNTNYKFEYNNVPLNCILHSHSKELSVNDLFDNNYHEMICGHHWAKPKIYENFSKTMNSISMQYYVDSILTNIIIIDERIQKNIVLQGKLYGKEIPFSFYFDNIGIFIPSPKIKDNLSLKYLDKVDSKKLKEYYKKKHEFDPNLNSKLLIEEKDKIRNYIINKSDKVHFIVLHLGILEKVLDDKSDEKNPDMIEKIITDLVPNESIRKKIVITSGRGKPNNLPQKYSFVPISPIQNAIETTFDKYRLVQILYNSRKSIY